MGQVLFTCPESVRLFYIIEWSSLNGRGLFPMHQFIVMVMFVGAVCLIPLHWVHHSLSLLCLSFLRRFTHFACTPRLSLLSLSCPIQYLPCGMINCVLVSNVALAVVSFPMSEGREIYSRAASVWVQFLWRGYCIWIGMWKSGCIIIYSLVLGRHLP